MDQLTYLQAIVIGVLQGVTELFPISSLGHSVLVPAWLGGSWKPLVEQEASPESPYLAFIVGLHVATALALLVLFWRDWVGIVGGFLGSLRRRRIETTYERLAWLIVLATIPAGLTGLLLEHSLRTLFAKPLAAAVFLTVNGVILAAAEYLRRRAPAHRPVVGTAGEAAVADDVDVAIGQQVSRRDAGVIGVVQTFALLPGISRSGVTMSGGLLRGLDPRGGRALLLPPRDALSSSRLACSRCPTSSALSATGSGARWRSGRSRPSGRRWWQRASSSDGSAPAR